MSQPLATGLADTARADASAGEPRSRRHRPRIAGWLAGIVALLCLVIGTWTSAFPPVPSPLALHVTFPSGFAPQGEPLITTGTPGNCDFLAVRYLDDQTAVFVYDVWAVGGPESAPFAVQPGVRRTLEIQMPALGHVSHVTRREKRPLRVVLDGRELLDTEVYFNRRSPDAIHFAANPFGGTIAGKSFRGQLTMPGGRELRGGPESMFTWRERIAWLLTERAGWLAAAVLASAASGLLAWRLALWGSRSPRQFRTRLTQAAAFAGAAIAPHRWFRAGRKVPVGPDADTGRADPAALHQARARRAWIGIITVAVLFYYFWTVVCSSDELPSLKPRGDPETDHFNLLSHGFLKGHLHLDGEVPRGLFEVANPYDPASRGKIEVLHDASFFRGKYYIYFGPAPVVSLFLPFTMLTGRDLPLPVAVWIYCSGGFLALSACFLFLQRRYFAGASTWTITTTLLALGGATLVVALLRRANVWEVAAASGFFFFAVSVLCLVRALHSPRATAWALAGGLALGMAIASRPTYIVGSALFALPLVFRRSRENGYRWRALLGAAAGCGALVLALLAYNYGRFEDPFEFGQKYQLSGTIEANVRHFSLSYAGFNAFVYFFSSLRWKSFFPFHDSISLPPFPEGHGGFEYSIGLLPNLPFSAFALVAFATLLGWRRRETVADGRWAPLVVIAAAALLNAALLVCYFGSCIRYMVDFAPWFMLLAGFGLLECDARLRHRIASACLRVLALGLALFSSFAAAMAVVDFYDSVPGVTPNAYRPVARVLNYPAFWIQQRQWPDYGPLEIALTLPDDRSPRVEPLITLTRGERRISAFFAEYLDESSIRFGYRETVASPAVFSPAIDSPPETLHTLQVSIGGPYSDFDGRKARLRVSLDGKPLWDVPVVSLQAFPGRPIIGEDPAAEGPARNFSGKIHSSRRLSHAELARPQLGGARVRMTLSPAMVGRSFPLMTSGKPGAGDLLFVRVERDDQVVFGYDHWGDAPLISPPVALNMVRAHVLEFWIPAVTLATGGPPEVIVKVDGAIAWRRRAPCFPASPATVYVGLNPIGGSISEPVLEHCILQETQLPWPRP